MRDKTICCFAGERKLRDINCEELKERVKEEAEKLIKKGINKFIISDFGDFETIAISVVRELKEKYENIKLGVMVSHRWAELFEEEYRRQYDEVISVYVNIIDGKRGLIKAAKKCMVFEARHLICYVVNPSGNSDAACVFRYAQKEGYTKIINLASQAQNE